MHYFKLHINDYAQATAHLTLIEDAVYTRLLRKYYADEKPLPADVERLQRLVGARSREEKAAVQTVLAEFFFRDGDFFRNKRADDELVEYASKSLKAKDSAHARWMRTHTERKVDAMPTQSEGNANHKPITNNQEPITSTNRRSNTRKRVDRPDDVTESVWEAWVELRNSKRAPISDVAVDKIRKEAAKASMSLDAALEMCCARGWQGFNAEWVDKRDKKEAAMDFLLGRADAAGNRIVEPAPWDVIDEPKRIL